MACSRRTGISCGSASAGSADVVDDAQRYRFDFDARLIQRQLGSAIVTVRSVGVGDARATYRVTLADGRTIAVRGVSGDGAQHRADTMRRHMERFAAAGLPVPPAVTVKAGEGWSLVTPWVDGDRGSSWLDAPERARQLAR